MDLITAAERRWLPDWLIRLGIRRLIARRRAMVLSESSHVQDELIDRLKASPLVLESDSANAQHYDVPSEFFRRVLGPRLKYSCALYSNPAQSLVEAEREMLELTCGRAELTDGMDILELGCGWGSLSLWMAEHYPNSKITAVSNSASQKDFIDRQCREAGLTNLRVITRDMRDFQTDDQFDRIVSVEMFEHMRNYEELLRRISGWLRPDGRLFVHIFCHRSSSYLFETTGSANWMGRHFFTGGIMPSQHLISRFSDDMHVTRFWRVDGTHYQRTAEAWLQNLDRHRHDIETLFATTLTRREARLMTQRWRMFFMACAELFGWQDGKEWFVAHYLLTSLVAPRPRTAPNADLARSVGV